jgi:hypothetical protein
MSEEKCINTIIYFDVAQILRIFEEWSRVVMGRKEEIKKIIESDKEADVLYSQIRHLAIEIQFQNRQYNDLAVRLSNLVTSLEILYSFMGEKYGEQFRNIVPPPPASITFHDSNKDNLN